jgi:hypothetical protein
MTAKRAKMMPTTRADAGPIAKAAIAQAGHNLQVADVLAAKGWYPDAFAKALAAAEETVRAYLYLVVSLDLATFDTKQAGPRQYFNEGDLHNHERKFAFFGGLEITLSMIEFALRIAAGGREEAERVNQELTASNATDAAADAYMQKYVPTVLPLLGGLPFWERARQAASYAGSDVRGDATYPATREEFELFRPIIGRRFDMIKEAIESPPAAGDLAELQELGRKMRLAKKGRGSRTKPGQAK